MDPAAIGIVYVYYYNNHKLLFKKLIKIIF